jgi:hypothetical protein
MHYWDGQPVRFVCCERKRQGFGEGDAESDVPWGRVLWCVAIQLVPDEPQAHEPQRGSRIANGVTNGAESHSQSDNGDSDGVD